MKLKLLHPETSDILIINAETISRLGVRNGGTIYLGVTRVDPHPLASVSVYRIASRVQRRGSRTVGMMMMMIIISPKASCKVRTNKENETKTQTIYKNKTVDAIIIIEPG
jgi:hypothetical protein